MHLLLPIYNNQEFLEKLEPDPLFRVTVFDNNSNDNSAQVANKKKWDVIKNKATSSRMENWERAAKYTIDNGDSKWCKWLFSGDALYPEAYGVLKQAQEKYPEVRLIIAEYDIVDEDGKKHPWKVFPATKVISPIESMQLIAEKGNWFGSPIGHCFHQEAVPQDLNLIPWQWTADMRFCMEIAKNHPVLYLSEKIGVFNSPQRKTYSSQFHAFESRIEEYNQRMRALEIFFELTGNKELHQQLIKTITKDSEKNIVESSFARNQTADHIIEAIPRRHSIKPLKNLFRFYSDRDAKV